jgi:hypothetical protein
MEQNFRSDISTNNDILTFPVPFSVDFGLLILNSLIANVDTNDDESF